MTDTYVCVCATARAAAHPLNNKFLIKCALTLNAPQKNTSENLQKKKMLRLPDYLNFIEIFNY